MKILRVVHRTVVTSVEVEISADQIRQVFNLPGDAEIFVEVPGGGDWSNIDLELGRRQPLKARYKRTEVTEEEPHEQHIPPIDRAPGADPSATNTSTKGSTP